MNEKKVVKSERKCKNCDFFRQDYKQVVGKQNTLIPVNVCIFEKSILGVKTLNYGSCFAVYKDGYCNYFREK